MKVLLDGVSENAGSILIGIFTLLGTLLGVWASARSQARERHLRRTEIRRDAAVEALRRNKEWESAAVKFVFPNYSGLEIVEQLQRPQLEAHHALASVAFSADDKLLQKKAIEISELHEQFATILVLTPEPLRSIGADYLLKVQASLDRAKEGHESFFRLAQRRYLLEGVRKKPGWTVQVRRSLSAQTGRKDQ